MTGSTDFTARIWAVDGSGEPIVLIGHERMINTAVFSQDGARVVTTSDDGTARIWAAERGGEPVVLRGHEGRVTTAVFNPDGTRVVTASWDSEARVWTVADEPLIDLACSRLFEKRLPEFELQRFGLEDSGELC